MERLSLAEAYAELLASDGVVRGLIGPRETPRLWTRHLLNSAVLAEQVPERATVADVGSGAGLPGIPLAIARPDVEVTLIEPLLRRATFLEEVVAKLELGNVSVLRARGEGVHRSEALAPGFDVVTSRAVASLSQLVDWCMPLVAPTGAMVALKGVAAVDEIAASRRALASWGCAEPTLHDLGVSTLTERTSAVRVAWADPASVSWPARRASDVKRDRLRSSRRRRA